MHIFHLTLSPSILASPLVPPQRGLKEGTPSRVTFMSCTRLIYEPGCSLCLDDNPQPNIPFSAPSRSPKCYPHTSFWKTSGHYSKSIFYDSFLKVKHFLSSATVSIKSTRGTLTSRANPSAWGWTIFMTI